MTSPFDGVRVQLASLDGAGLPPGDRWSVAQHLVHAAESIDCSIDGFPELKSALVRATVGPLVLRFFLMRGRMSHDVQAPLPGGVPPSDMPFAAAQARLEAAMARLEAHEGTLAPHAVFGVIGKADYLRYHALHVADHLQKVAAKRRSLGG